MGYSSTCSVGSHDDWSTVFILTRKGGTQLIFIVSKYNRITPIYELIDLPLELFFFRKWRTDAISNLGGKVLEVGVGTGKKLKLYSSRCSVTGINYREKILEKASKKARGMTNVTIFLMDPNAWDFRITTLIML